MKRLAKTSLGVTFVIGAAFVVLPVAKAAAADPINDTTYVADKDQSRSLSGSVLDKSEAPLSGAIVYLKNMKTLTVKSYISDNAGEFRFNSLSPNVDYEVYAEFNGTRSNTKTLSSFDSRKAVQMLLKVDVKK